MNTEFWHWPQYTILILLLLRVFFGTLLHGRPAPKHDWFVSLIRFSIIFIPLYFGGFFNGH